MILQPQHSHFALLQARRVFLMGIRGVGMTALAVLLRDAGVAVVGADVEESFVTDVTLSQLGIAVQSLTDELPADIEAVIYSGAHKGSHHPLVLAAKNRNLPTLSLAQAVGVLSRGKQTIGVAGVGGKSSTTGLLAWLLEQAHQEPSFAVGVGSVPNFGLSGRWVPNSKAFVVEADEYVADPSEDRTPRFLYLSLHDLIVTSLRFDHPDVYESLADTKQAFLRLMSGVAADGILVVNGDDPELLALVTEAKPAADVWTVGEAATCRVQVAFSRDGSGMKIELRFPGQDPWTFTSHLIGEHNAHNIAYAVVMAACKGASLADMQDAVESFLTLPRRLEWRGETPAGAWCFDDYAHHPHEIQAIGTTLHTWFPEKRLIIAFQPHTYSRTRSLFTEFFTALKNTNATLWLLPIFASAREQFDPTTKTEDLVEALVAAGADATLIPSIPELAERIATLQSGDLVITLGAGDIYHVYDQNTSHHSARASA